MSILEGYMESSMILNERAEIVEFPKNNRSDYVSSLSYNGININIRTSSNEKIYEKDDKELIDILRRLDQDFSIFKKGYPTIENSVFTKYLSEDNKWNDGTIRTLKQIKSIAKLSSIAYIPYNGGKGSFSVVYNDGANRNKKFYYGHILTIEVMIKDGKIKLTNDSIDG